jgi:polyisoprenoid-binding protein YceI
METIIPSIIILLGLLSIITEQRPMMQKVVFGLIGLSLISLTHIGFGEKDPQTVVLGVLSTIIGVGIAAGLLLKKHGEWFAVAATFLAFILGSYTITYFGYELKFDRFVVLLPLFGAIAPVLANVKAKLFHNWFGVDVAKTTRGISIFMAALLVFFAMFQAQYFGVILVASGWLAVGLATRAFYTSGSGIAFLSLGFVFILMKTNGTTDDSFLRGNFLMGLLAGIGAMYWVVLSKGAVRFRWPLMFILPVLIVLAMIMLGKANENFGGIPAYIGALIGASLGLLALANEQQTVSFQALLIGISGLVLAQFAPEKTTEKKSRVAQTETVQTTEETEQPDVLDVPAIVPDAKMAGNWKSDNKASKVDFQLGPEGGVTKGGVEGFDVRLKMNAGAEPEQLTVKIPSAKVTTFNPMRDETVHGATYLNVARFPNMSYTSTAIRKDGEHYIVSGNFEMLGKKAPLELKLKFAAGGKENGKDFLVMVGKTAVDRTKFGMTSDAKIGDVVEVTFEIEFKR